MKQSDENLLSLGKLKSLIPFSNSFTLLSGKTTSHSNSMASCTETTNKSAFSTISSMGHPNITLYSYLDGFLKKYILFESFAGSANKTLTDVIDVTVFFHRHLFYTLFIFSTKLF